MRMWAIILSALLLASPLSAQQSSERSVLERLDALEADRDALEAVLAGAIIASPEPCATLGAGWAPYTAAEGRFLLGAGAGYGAGSEGGEPRVTLTEAQMPRHHHRQTWGQAAGDKKRPASGNTIRRYYVSPIQSTGPAGESKPHENMPPYRVIHFCKLGG